MTDEEIEPDAWRYWADDPILDPNLVQDKITAKKFGNRYEPLYSAETIQEKIQSKIDELEIHKPYSEAEDGWTEAVNGEIRAQLEILEELEKVFSDEQ